MQASPRQRIILERRKYNQWVASQTLEDYALRYTPPKARRWSAFRIGNTAFGAIAFLACEAIGAVITLHYGAANALAAIISVCGLMFLLGLPIIVYAARHGLDIDLLTRGAGFGYLGSTITSLVYASFTFLLLAVEASIMSVALGLVFGIPIALAHVISALVVIPIAIYGIRLISWMQLATQPIWLLLQLVPLVFIALYANDDLGNWLAYPGVGSFSGSGLSLIPFGIAASLLLSLLPQIGEQADYLRFLPERASIGRWRWWSALLLGGPGWVLMGGAKLVIGSMLVWILMSRGVPADLATDPSGMYYAAFLDVVRSPGAALILTGLFVVVCQLKINVTNAYAGSIAWSNFFSRLTHNHPGRVVWLVFNVVVALLLMQVGIFRVIEGVLVVYACFAAGWIGALTADLVINKPLGISPAGIEFRRAYLYDINPVGIGAMGLAIVLSMLSYVGWLGQLAQVFAPFVALSTAFVAAPLIAVATRGRYYLARQVDVLAGDEQEEVRCEVCQNLFARKDMAWCPAYCVPICSLCCTLEARCRDQCKSGSRVSEQMAGVFGRILPQPLASLMMGRVGRFLLLLVVFACLIGALLLLIYLQVGDSSPAHRFVIGQTLWVVFFCLLIMSGVFVWLFLLNYESGRAAQLESDRQSQMLLDEIEAHKQTDLALQKAKEVAEAANEAKTRYVVGISHEIRSPLNSIYGYAQLLERNSSIDPGDAVRVIRRSSEHLADLVDGLLDISKMEGGLMRISRDTVQFPDFLEQIVDMFRLQAKAKGVAFEYQRPLYLPEYVHTDQKRLRQVLINLLSNAIKFTQRGSVTFTVRYRAQIAEFEILDTGLGIPLEDQQTVFEPFERGNLAAARMVPGTGLGLTITKLLVQMMGGEITMRSEVGTGSRFVVKLMLSSVSPSMAYEVVKGQVLGYAGPVQRVLLVDDNPLHLDLVRGILEPLGFELAMAADGASALELAARFQPHLALLDVGLPAMTGWEVADRLRELGIPNLKIIILSGNAHEYSSGDSESTSHDAFVMKPVNVDLLLDSISNLLGLQWKFAEPEPGPVEAVDRPSYIFKAGSEHYLDELYQLGRIGHVRAIHGKLRRLIEEYPEAKPFAARLQGLIDSYDFKAYLAVLDEARDDD